MWRAFLSNRLIIQCLNFRFRGSYFAKNKSYKHCCCHNVDGRLDPHAEKIRRSRKTFSKSFIWKSGAGNRSSRETEKRERTLVNNLQLKFSNMFYGDSLHWVELSPPGREVVILVRGGYAALP
ncbi:hypothetical protein GOODEAATRI_023428 [Goodea atripinnis]|uniref:Uncharacterized protein n=1 Tax=Goodea atripinnis TaxID=208336 RepID=A0ABV0NX23_9TELE